MRTLGAAVTATVLVAPALAAQQGTLQVAEAVVAREVVDRMPMDTATTFPAEVGRVYAWTRITGADGSATIHHVWFQGDEERADIPLTVAGSPWRTWSSKTIPPEWAGAWRVEVRDDAGTVLATVRFTVGEGGT